MRYLIALAFLAASPAVAQDAGHGYSLSADLGLGASYGPSYMGSEDKDTSAWIILRNAKLLRPGASGETSGDGFAILPSFRMLGSRDADDHDELSGMNDIDRAGELGARMIYDYGNARGFLALRKGFGGHDGFVGELGARYLISASDRLTLTTTAEARFGDSDFTETYFGVTPEESARSGYTAYTPEGGFYAAAVGLEARYAITPDMAVLGEVQYTRLLDDAADSPIVQSEGEPRVRLGVVRRFDFRF